MSNKIPIAVVTTFQDLPRSYGLVPVVLNQIKQLVDRGHEVGFYTQEGFQTHPDSGDVPREVELMPRVPFCHLYDYQDGTKLQNFKTAKVKDKRVKVDGKGIRVGKRVYTNFERQVEYIEKGLEEWLMEYPVVITHDIMFQTWFVTHNQAIRNIGEKHPEIRWIHWLHSGPSPRPVDPQYPHVLRYSDMPNSVFVSPNKTMIPKFAEMYDVPIKYIKPVYHTFDPYKFFDFHELSKKIIAKHKLFDCDGLIVYPTRVDHPEGKGMFHTIHLVAMMNRYADIKFLFLNSWSAGQKAKNNIQRLKNEAKKWGLPTQNLIFSSEMDKQWENGVPGEVVRDMFIIGNMFIHSSQTETFSLIMLEAAATKNMLILNEDLGVFKELAEDRADYIPTGSEWGGEKVTRHYWAAGKEGEQEDPKNFWRERAHHLLARLGLVNYHCEHCNKELGNIGAYKPLLQHRHVLKYYNADWVYENQLKPLIDGSNWR